MIITSWLEKCARLVVVAAMVFGLASASAQTVLIDFGNDSSFRGLSVNNPDDNGNYWNSLRTGVFYQDLIDLSNSATTLDFGFSTNVGTDSYNGPAGATDASTLQIDVLFTDIDAAALGNLGGALEAAFDYVTSPDPPDPVTGRNVRFEIQQLDPTKTYNLTFFGSHKFNADPTTVYSVYSDNTYSTLVDSVSLDVHDPVSPWLHNRDMVATISNLRPQTSDILYVEFVGSSGDYGYLNAMQIEAITPDVLGDFNNDSMWNCTDIDMLTQAIAAGSMDLLYDMNGDGSITRADITDASVGWLAVGGAQNPTQTAGNPFLEGDSDLSGGVDGSDFNEWNNNKFTINANFCDGDFNADGQIDGGDFGIWNNNKFQSSAAISTVPEPSAGLGLTVLILLTTGAVVRRRGEH